MIDFAKRRARPIVSTLETEDVKDFTSVDDTTVIGYWPSDDATSNQMFSRLAALNLDFYTFGVVHDAQAASEEGYQRPTVVLHKKYDERRVVYDGSMDEQAVIKFIDTAAIPSLGEYDRKWNGRYFSTEVRRR